MPKSAEILVSAKKLVRRLNERPVLDAVDLEIRAGEQWLIAGGSGSGKTSLGRVLAGLDHAGGDLTWCFPEGSEGIAFVEQQHWFRNRSNTADFYYQQRYNSMDADDSETIGDVIAALPDAHRNHVRLSEWGLGGMEDKPLVQLSNGENKRFQLAIAVSPDPFMIVLDSPFTGLDAAGRALLSALIDELAAGGKLIVLIGRIDDAPACMTHLLMMDKGQAIFSGSLDQYAVTKKMKPLESATSLVAAPFLQPAPAWPVFETAIRMEAVNVRYGERLILDNINWTVKKGECWSISGPNGAGKSTLLSLVNADNPQGYANELYLFDRRRGSGESIWDIKKHIGYVSPELHLSFDRGSTVREVIASGLFDTIGLFRLLNDEQEVMVAETINLADLLEIGDKALFQLSLGQQRLVLLARAVVKNPPMLILDEPCQGLDEDQAASIRLTIDGLCRATGTTLLYVSHYTSDVPSCVNHFLELERGKQVRPQV